MAINNNTSKKRTTAPRLPQVPNVSNYDKLRNNNKNDEAAKFMKFNPFITQRFSDKVKKNHEAEALNQSYLDEQIYYQLLMQSGMYKSNRGVGRTSFFNLDPKTKRNELIRLSSHDQLDEILTKITDEIIVTDQNDEPIEIEIDKSKLESLKVKPEVIKKIQELAPRIFNEVWDMYGFSANGTSTSIWNKVYLFMIEGTQAYEIVYDDINNPTKIIGLLEIDALSLDEFYYDGIKYYRHYKELATKDPYVILNDNQVVLIRWSDGSPNNRFSYLEQLVKSFNNARIIDEASIRWTVTNSMYRMIFKVPTKGKSRTAAAMTLATEMNRFKDEITYDSSTGELVVNGSTSAPFSKEYWMAEGDNGTPDIETVDASGPAFNSTELNEHFNKKLYRNAKLPYSRFDSSASETWNMDTRAMLREEINFGRFINRVRSIYNTVLLKPLYLQLAKEIPEIENDQAILKAVKLRYNSYNVFEEMMMIDIMREKAEGISALHDAFKIQTPDGEEKPFFALEFLIREHMPDLTEDKLKINKDLLDKEQIALFDYQKKVYELKQKYDPEVQPDNNF